MTMRTIVLLATAFASFCSFDPVFAAVTAMVTDATGFQNLADQHGTGGAFFYIGLLTVAIVPIVTELIKTKLGVKNKVFLNILPLAQGILGWCATVLAMGINPFSAEGWSWFGTIVGGSMFGQLGRNTFRARHK